jgi:hypothetical protein
VLELLWWNLSHVILTAVATSENKFCELFKINRAITLPTKYLLISGTLNCLEKNQIKVPPFLRNNDFDIVGTRPLFVALSQGA